MYYVFVQKHPWHELNDYSGVSKRILAGERANLSQISGNFAALITRCWSANPAERPTFAELSKEFSSNEILNSLATAEKKVSMD